MNQYRRASGILLPVFSLPGPFGIGTFGQSARDFIDFLHDAGQSCWQILPLNPAGGGNSPYSGFSAFAGNTLFLDPDLLAEDGLLTREEAEGYREENTGRVDYARRMELSKEMLKTACKRGLAGDRTDFEAFRQENAAWLADYALYTAVKDCFNGLPWTNWPDNGLRLHEGEAVLFYRDRTVKQREILEYAQFLFFRQWKALKDYAGEKGISIIGDLPLYVSLDSADVWAHPEYFELDEENMPVEVAGVPPDYFSEEGQLWGNPLYNWEKMKEEGYGWWIRRIGSAFSLYDMLRIDHFRGLSTYWSVPAEAESAVSGRWRKGPGMDLVGVLTSWFYDRQFIAEDLGLLTPDVYELLEQSGLPGMKVLEFAFSSGPDNAYLPHNYTENCVCYVGTHDNTTARDWLETAEPAERQAAADYLGLNEEEGENIGFIRAGMTSKARLFIAQMADWLNLGAEGRINVPGIPEGNWTFRLPEGVLRRELAEKIARLTELSGRGRNEH